MTTRAPSAPEDQLLARPEPPLDRPRSSITVPRPLLLVCGGVVLAGILMTILGAWSTGVTTDEPYHVERMQNLFAHGWYLIDGELLHGQPSPGARNTYVYAPVTGILLHAWNLLWGVDRPGHISATAQAYAFRHLAIALIGLAGVAAVAATARLLLRSWRWGVVAAGILLAIPMWPGQSMFNVKDVPVATGYSLVTLGLTALLLRAPARGQSRLASASLVMAGTVLAVGTRPGMWTAIALSCGAFGAMTLARTSLSPRARLLAVIQAAAAVGAAAGALVVIYPAGFGHPWRVLVDSALASSDFAGIPGVWWYVPVFVVAQLPSLLLLLLGATWFEAAGRTRKALARPWSPRVMALVLVTLQAGALPALAVVRQSHLYNGLRQLLFACPALALLVTCGLYLATAAHEPTRARRAAGVALTTLACAAVLVPTAAQVRLFPYNYAYASAGVDLAGLPAVDDYWRASVRELEPRVPRNEFVVCGAYTTPDGTTLRRADQGVSLPKLSGDCRTSPNSPLRPYRTDGADHHTVDPTFLAVYTDVVRVGSNCSELAAVTRAPYGRIDTLSAVARCRLVLAPYPSGGVRFAAADAGKDFLLGGWTGSARGTGLDMEAPAASIGLRLAAPMAGEPLEIALGARLAPAVEVWVNNRPADYTKAGDNRIRIRVSARRAASFGDRRLVLTLIAPHPADRAVQLTSLRVREVAR